MKTFITAIALAALIVPGVTSARPVVAKSDQVRLDRHRVGMAIDGFVDDGRTAGAAVLIWQGGRERCFHAAGLADREAGRPFRRDTLIQIFSMTKPVTGVALMQLYEEGRFRLDDPLALYLPEFGAVQVWDGKSLRPPSRAITIRDVLRHTAGFSYGWEDGVVGKAWNAEQPLAFDHDLAEFGRRLARVPLVADPGARWSYSAAVDVQALLVEKISGQRFADYVRDRIFVPLGMTESGWTPPPETRSRLAAMYQVPQRGTFARVPDKQWLEANYAGAKLTMGGSGIVTTVDDYMRFARMLLGEGSLDGVRILKPSTVRLMSSDQLDPAVTERSFLNGKIDGGFGFNFAVRTARPADLKRNRGAVGEFFWDGYPSMLFWVDPANDLAVVFATQKLPFDDALHTDVRKAVYGPAYLGPAGD